MFSNLAIPHWGTTLYQSFTNSLEQLEQPREISPNLSTTKGCVCVYIYIYRYIIPINKSSWCLIYNDISPHYGPWHPTSPFYFYILWCLIYPIDYPIFRWLISPIIYNITIFPGYSHVPYLCLTNRTCQAHHVVFIVVVVLLHQLRELILPSSDGRSS